MPVQNKAGAVNPKVWSSDDTESKAIVGLTTSLPSPPSVEKAEHQDRVRQTRLGSRR